MSATFAVLLITFTALLSPIEALNCTLSLPRLLLGDQYSNPTQSNETALIIFDTLDQCKQATLLPLNGSDFKFRLKEIVAQFVDEELSHAGKSAEFVSYSKYSIVFAITAEPGTAYSVGFQGDSNDESTKSQLNYQFILPIQKPQTTSSASPKILFYGDQDLTEKGATTINYLKTNANSLKFDAFVFLGDYAYEFYQNNGQKGDAFIESFAPLSFSYPLVMTPGNHEDNLNFTLFNEKFRLPGFSLNNLNNYNSFNIGNIHFLHVNLDYFGLQGESQRKNMLDWVINDIKSTDRTITPWVIAVGHKLINCYDAQHEGNVACVGYITEFQAFDQLFGTLGVDMFITGHEHYNQVMAPMYNKTIQPYTFNEQSGELSYTRGGYISIIQGNGGCYKAKRERILGVEETLKSASILLDQTHTGFGWIQAMNNTYLEYHSIDAYTGNELVFYKITTNHTLIQSEVPNNPDIPSPSKTNTSRMVANVILLFTMLAFL